MTEELRKVLGLGLNGHVVHFFPNRRWKSNLLRNYDNESTTISNLLNDV